MCYHGNQCVFITLDEKFNLQIPSNLLQRFGTAAVCIALLIFISGLYDFTLHLQIRKYDGLTYCGRIAKTTAFRLEILLYIAWACLRNAMCGILHSCSCIMEFIELVTYGTIMTKYSDPILKVCKRGNQYVIFNFPALLIRCKIPIEGSNMIFH